MRLFLSLIAPALVVSGILPSIFPPAKTTGATISKPTGVSIGSVSYTGSGCPSGSVSTSLSSDKTVVTLGFDRFQTYIGPGTSLADHSKNCKLLLSLKYPPGYSFTVISSTYHGYAQLDPGVTGTFSSLYFFSSLPTATLSSSTSVLGGSGSGSAWTDGAVYTKSNSISTPKLVLSPCGLLSAFGSNAVLNVDNTISLTSSNASASGQMTDDDATVQTTQQVTLKWITC
ncbi:unnamed protein product [Discula destructiva]